MSDDTGSPRWAVAFLQELGWTRVAAIALVANLMWESGGRGGINWSAHGDKGRDGQFHSHGAGQWNDRHGRYQNLLKYADEHGKPWNDPEMQLRYLDKEMKSTERTVRRNLVEETDIDKATALAALRFWRPSIPHVDRRVKIAEALAKDYPDGGTQVADARA